MQKLVRYMKKFLQENNEKNIYMNWNRGINDKILERKIKESRIVRDI